jgi:hypothetical protein
LLFFHNVTSRPVITITDFAVSRSQKPIQGLRNSFGSFAALAAIRRTSSRVQHGWLFW